jgi:hypothetical protein
MIATAMPVAAVVNALLAPGQLWLARVVGAFEPAQEYTAGNDEWPLQQYLLAWYTASAIALSAAVAWTVAGRVSGWEGQPDGVAGRGPGWIARLGVMAAAVAGALPAYPLARAWSAGAVAIADPVGDATRAVTVGLVVGAGGALLATASPAVRRGLIVWTGWTWAMTAAAVAAGRSMTPFGLPPTPRYLGRDEWAWELKAMLCPLVVFAVLGAWAARRGDRLPVAGALCGPLLLSSPSGVLTQFNGFHGDHYSPRTEFLTWLFVSLVGAAVAAGTAALFRAGRRTPAPAPVPATPTPALPDGTVAPILLRVAGGLLLASALLWAAGPLQGRLAVVAATGALAFAVGLLAARGARLRPLYGLAVTGMAYLAVVVLLPWFENRSVEHILLPLALSVDLPVACAIGLLARGVRAVAGTGLAVVLVTAWIVVGSGLYRIGLDEPADTVPGLVLMLLGAAALAGALAASGSNSQPTGGPPAPEPTPRPTFGLARH